MADCNTSTLKEYVPSTDMPWNESRVKHFYSRLGYGANKADIIGALNQSPLELVHSALDNAHNKPVQNKPIWADWNPDQFNEQDDTEHYQIYNRFTTDWINYSIQDPIREKILFFWSNVLVVQWGEHYYTPYLYQYHNLLQRNAMGNFRTMIREIGLDKGMLIYLSGVYNHKWDPNENYARELYELFTLGLDNGYTQQDIRETARAFTGYNDFDYDNMTIQYNPETHDNDEKTIFGETANFDYNGVIDLLFEKKGMLIAQHTCKKIYAHFVNAEVNNDIINELAQILVDNDFELLPVYKKLFASEHFFDAHEFNTHIKSHTEYFSAFLKQFDLQLDYDSGPSFIWFCSSLGQTYFEPVDVAGWKENKTWIDSGSLLVRWLYTGWFLSDIIWNQQDQAIAYLKELTNDSNDVEYVVRTLADQYLVQGLASQSDYDNLLIAFKADLPDNYYAEGLWNLDWDPNFISVQMSRFFETFKRLPDITLG